MIVSAFTQRHLEHEYLQGCSQDHSHCIRCVKQLCNVRPDDRTSCQVVDCIRGCGRRYHACKEGEHTLLCREERVACINKCYGCPAVFARKKLGQHLCVCPASVMSCNAEWNRWALSTSLPTSMVQVECGQLDVALAARDQRTLIRAFHTPKYTELTSRTPLTMKNTYSLFQQPSLEYSTPTSESVMPNVSHETDILSNSTELQLHDHQIDADQLMESSGQTASFSLVAQATDHNQDQCPDVEHEAAACHCLSTYSNSDGQDLQPHFAEDISVPRVMASEVDQTSQREKNLTSIDANSVDADLPKGLRSVVRDLEIFNNMSLHRLLGVNINVESITKYQPKPENMYTFLCAQNFRRDEYPSHFNNVHNEIQSGLNGWMEQRCPLAYLGCPFSFRRFRPPQKAVTVCHSWLLESFGLKSGWPEELSSHQTPNYIIPAVSIGVDPAAEAVKGSNFSLARQILPQTENTSWETFSSGSELTFNLASFQGLNIGSEPIEHIRSQLDNQYLSQAQQIAGSCFFRSNIDESSDILDMRNPETAATGSSFELLVPKCSSPETVDCVASPVDKTLKTFSPFNDIHDNSARAVSFLPVRDLSISSEQFNLKHSDLECSSRYQSDNTYKTNAVNLDSALKNEAIYCKEPGKVQQMGNSYQDKLPTLLNENGENSSVVVSLPSLCNPSYAQHPRSTAKRVLMPHSPTPDAVLVQPVIYTGYCPNSPVRVDYTVRVSNEALAVSSENTRILLTSLPFEILQHIVRFLDSFSICNLALVSRLLRDVCCSLLEERGIVTLIWKPQKFGSRNLWHITGKKWNFSTSFSCVQSWKFTDHNPIARHLQTCPYNQDRLIRTDPFCIIPDGTGPINEQIRAMIAEKEKRRKSVLCYTE